MPAGSKKYEIQTFPMNVGIFGLVQACIGLFFIAYFGAIAILTWLNTSWLEHWFLWWTPITDVFRQFVGTFDNIERQFIAKGFAQRVAVIHHLMTIGWITFILGFTLSIVILLRMSQADWNSIKPIWPKGKRFAIGSPLFFIASLYLIFVLIGRVNENPLWAVHKYDAALLGLAVGFYGAQLTGVFTLINIGLWAALRSAGSRANHR
jgi:hypothetical protein